MSDLNTKSEQEKVFREILSRYDKDTCDLYFDILKTYSTRGAGMTKKAVRDEILDKVKEVVK